MTHEILLYYRFTSIEDPQTLVDEHQALCDSLHLKGRIFIGHEGINGTVSGLKEHTKAYRETLQAHPVFKGISFKIDDADDHAFAKMHVRLKQEIVRLELDDAPSPTDKTAPALKPLEFYQLMQQDNVVILDTRNQYEYDLGRFKGAINPGIDNFRDLPAWLKEHQASLKDKTILTYCTGGIRCEKLTGWMMEQGFSDVYQLEGGIITYGQDPQTKGIDWEGQCYVFDRRIGVAINQVNPEVVGRDYFDGTPCERYINCANPECNKKILASLDNEIKHKGSCSDACREHPNNRFDESNYKKDELFN